MLQCPLCRAALNGADTCRRCRAQLKQAVELERQAGQIAGEAMHALTLGKTAVALRLLGRANLVHATPEMRLLARILARQIASSSEALRAVHHGAVDERARKYPLLD
jgi:predicted amidophosphoribosyltransferase